MCYAEEEEELVHEVNLDIATTFLAFVSKPPERMRFVMTVYIRMLYR